MPIVLLSHDFSESLHVQGHKQHIGGLCNGGNERAHTVTTHNVPSGIVDLCTPRYVSTVASCLHSVVSRGTFHFREDISMRGVAVTNAAAADVEPAGVDLHGTGAGQ